MSEVARPVKVRHGRMKSFEILADQTLFHLPTKKYMGGGERPREGPTPIVHSTQDDEILIRN